MNKAADKNMEDAEAKGSLTFVSKANALRRKAKEKTEEATNVRKELNEKSQLLKNM